MDITLNVTLEEANLILHALQEVPYKVSHRLIAKLTEQGQQQFNAANEEKTVDLSPKE